MISAPKDPIPNNPTPIVQWFFKELGKDDFEDIDKVL